LSYVGNDLEDRSSIADSSKKSDKDDLRISRDSLYNRDLEDFDDIPSTTVYPTHAQVEGEDFNEEASLSESVNWDFLLVKSLPTDYEDLKKHLTRSQVSLESDIDSHSKHCGDSLSLAANSWARVVSWRLHSRLDMRHAYRVRCRTIVSRRKA